MIEVKTNLWTYKKADFICITTNGFINKVGHCVMGRGCALEAKRKYPELPKLLGNLITHFGNRVFALPNGIISFPVKHNWWEEADLDLIAESKHQLEELIDLREYKVLLPRPGCGNGNLDWRDVKPIFRYVDDNLIICRL